MKKGIKWFGILAGTAVFGLSLVACGSKKKAVETTTGTGTGEQTGGQTGEQTGGQTGEEIDYAGNLINGLQADFVIKDSTFEYADDESEVTFEFKEAGKVTNADGSVKYVAKFKATITDFYDVKALEEENKTLAEAEKKVYKPSVTEGVVTYENGVLRLAGVDNSTNNNEEKTEKTLDSYVAIDFLKKTIINLVSLSAYRILNESAEDYFGATLNNLGLSPKLLSDLIGVGVDKAIKAVNDNTVELDLTQFADYLTAVKKDNSYVLSVDYAAYVELVKGLSDYLTSLTFDDLQKLLSNGEETLPTDKVIDWVAQYADLNASKFIESVEKITGSKLKNVEFKADIYVRTLFGMVAMAMPSEECQQMITLLAQNYPGLDAVLLGVVKDLYDGKVDLESVTSFADAVEAVDEAAKDNTEIDDLTTGMLVTGVVKMFAKMFNIELPEDFAISGKDLNALKESISTEKQTIVQFVYSNLAVIAEKLGDESEVGKKLAKYGSFFQGEEGFDGSLLNSFINNLTEAGAGYVNNAFKFEITADEEYNPSSLTVAVNFDAKTYVEKLYTEFNTANSFEETDEGYLSVDKDAKFPKLVGAFTVVFGDELEESYDPIVAVPDFDDAFVEEVLTKCVADQYEVDEDDITLTKITDEADQSKVLAYEYTFNKDVKNLISGEVDYTLTYKVSIDKSKVTDTYCGYSWKSTREKIYKLEFDVWAVTKTELAEGSDNYVKDPTVDYDLEMGDHLCCVVKFELDNENNLKKDDAGKYIYTANAD